MKNSIAVKGAKFVHGICSFLNALLGTAVIVSLIVFMLPECVFSFHEGGVTFCEGCHFMTETEGGADTGFYALKGLDASSTCLRCHSEQGKFYNINSSDGSSYTPGGDFYWLKKNFAWYDDNVLMNSPGSDHGHNVIAVEYGLNPDAVHIRAPGGEHSSNSLGCTSCHDPHAISTTYNDTSDPYMNGSNYRLLGGKGYTSGEETAFIYPAPVAVSNPGDWRETDFNHAAYGSGMSEWCANCHPAFLNAENIIPSGYSENLTDMIVSDYISYVKTGNLSGSRAAAYLSLLPFKAGVRDKLLPDPLNTFSLANNGTCVSCHSEFLNTEHKHPSGNNDKIPAMIVSNYNSYVKSGDLTGSQANSYFSLVPFETGVRDKSLLDPLSTSGPSNGTANVMCLTCHRAHASAFHDIGRWDFRTVFISGSHPRHGDKDVFGNDPLHSYYGRDISSSFGILQRQLCNKCHVKD